MKKGWPLLIGLVLVPALLGVIGCKNDTPSQPEPSATINNMLPSVEPDSANRIPDSPAHRESGFNFIFKYGPTANNILDTFNGTFSKDMVYEPNILINLSLSEEEMGRIYSKMNNIDFFNYPDVFYNQIVFFPDRIASGEPPFHAKSSTRYYFKVEHNSQNKELFWTDSIIQPTQEVEKLRELVTLIRSIIEIKQEYQDLPEPKSPYLSSPAPIESGFNMIFIYGVAGNRLDTFQGTYTKDMVSDPSITVYLHLSEEEKASIYQKMVNIDFFNYPDVFSISVPPGEPAGIVTPSSSYYFKVEYDSQNKELWWADSITNPNEKADKLRELIKFITDIIESKEQYKQLPQPTSGYI